MQKHRESDALSSLQSLLGTVVIAAFVITFIVQAFQIPSESMENTLLIGDYLLVDKLRYGGSMWDHIMPYRPVRRGDVIVFRYDLAHGVKAVDPEKEIDWKSESGKWTVLLELRETHGQSSAKM